MISKIPPPITGLRSKLETSSLIISEADIPADAHLIGEIEVRSKEQPHISLGNYSKASPPKAFTIHVDPKPEPEAIVAQMTRLGVDSKYELVLHIANYGNKTISVEVWEI